jgi:hypothetical protein
MSQTSARGKSLMVNRFKMIKFATETYEGDKKIVKLYNLYNDPVAAGFLLFLRYDIYSFST